MGVCGKRRSQGRGREGAAGPHPIRPLRTAPPPPTKCALAARACVRADRRALRGVPQPYLPTWEGWAGTSKTRLVTYPGRALPLCPAPPLLPLPPFWPLCVVAVVVVVVAAVVVVVVVCACRTGLWCPCATSLLPPPTLPPSLPAACLPPCRPPPCRLWCGLLQDGSVVPMSDALQAELLGAVTSMAKRGLRCICLSYTDYPLDDPARPAGGAGPVCVCVCGRGGAHARWNAARRTCKGGAAGPPSIGPCASFAGACLPWGADVEGLMSHHDFMSHRGGGGHQGGVAPRL